MQWREAAFRFKGGIRVHIRLIAFHGEGCFSPQRPGSSSGESRLGVNFCVSNPNPSQPYKGPRTGAIAFLVTAAHVMISAWNCGS